MFFYRGIEARTVSRCNFQMCPARLAKCRSQVDLSQIIMHEADEPNTVVDLFSDGHANSVALVPMDNLSVLCDIELK